VERRDSDGGSNFEARLGPEEHPGFVWATEEEVRACKVGDVEIGFTIPEQEAVVLNAFAVLTRAPLRRADAFNYARLSAQLRSRMVRLFPVQGQDWLLQRVGG
jgi:hypothetical protein